MEKINEHKILWEKLLSEDDFEAKYIYTDGDIGFRESGLRDYNNLIKNDIYLKQRLGSFSNKVMVEIGCGNGRMTEFFANDFKKVYAVDISGEVIKAGKARLGKYDNIEWVETDGMHLPSIQVDFVFSYITFQHCNREIVEISFEEIDKILLLTGIAKIQVRGKKIRQDKWYSGCWFTKDEICKLANSAGFSILNTFHDPKERRYLWIWAI